MIRWGISANSHNAALSVFIHNKLVFASESERYTKIKNDGNLSEDLISAAGTWGEPKEIYWYENPYIKTIRQLLAGQGWTAKENNIVSYLANYDIKSKIIYSNHHGSHAAAGYYTGPFREATIVTIDSIGEFETLTIWAATGRRLKKLYSNYYPDSVGLWYSAMTQRIGLKPNEEEYILMGMSSYGDPNRFYRDILNDFVDIDKIKIKQNLHRGCPLWRSELTSQQDMFDIAAATQRIYEELFESILHKAAKLSKSKNLVLMGGCALNCVANILAYKYFQNLWIMPAPGDNGSAIGAVLHEKKDFIEWPGVYLGHDIGYHERDESIVDYLYNNRACGVARGRAEFGPRALGNRSLLANPTGPDIKNFINTIKKREKFRPFAPAILEEFADQYFDLPVSSSPYMQLAVRCKKPQLFPAIVHVDGTSRVQTVNKHDNPQFYGLLKLWYEKTGCPMLLNTSLNVKGQPMINDRADADLWSETYGLPVFT